MSNNLRICPPYPSNMYRLFLSIQKKNQTEWRNVDETPFTIDSNRRELMDYDYMRDVFAHCGVQIIKN